MDLYPLDPLGLSQLPELQRITRQGEMARLYRGERTIGEILRSASKAMDEEDAELERQRDPLAWIRAPRRRSLLNRLLGRS